MKFHLIAKKLTINTRNLKSLMVFKKIFLLLKTSIQKKKEKSGKTKTAKNRLICVAFCKTENCKVKK